jgi:hypothetical protein
MDTFIADDNIWEMLKEQTGKIYAELDIVKRIRLRKVRVQEFYACMSRLYDVLYDEAAACHANGVRIR